MSIQIRDTSYKEKSEPCWNDMEELKYLICAIDAWYVQLIVRIKEIRIITCFVRGRREMLDY